RLSPDGKCAVWVKSIPDKDKNEHVGHLFRAGLAGGREVQLTRGPDGCTSPRWAPDGRHVAFLSTRPAPKAKGKPDEGPKTQVWRPAPTGAEPGPLPEHPRGVQRFGWAGPDAVVFAAQEEAGRRETALKDEKKDDSHVVEDEPHEPPVRLY